MPSSDVNIFEHIARTWRPSETCSTDRLDPAPAAALSAVLDLPETVSATRSPVFAAPGLQPPARICGISQPAPTKDPLLKQALAPR